LNLSNNKFDNAAFAELVDYFAELNQIKVMIIMEDEKIKYN